MPVKDKNKWSFEDAVAALRDHGFEVQDVDGERLIKKYGCAAPVDRDPLTGRARVTQRPGYVIAGEISALVDKGYQKFLKTSKIELPATSDILKAVHRFSEELKEAAGLTSLYNEALGTVSDRYVYDRIKDRDDDVRPVRPWEIPPA